MESSLQKNTAATGYIIAIIGTILWSTTGVLIRYLNDAFLVPSLVIAFWRDAFVAVTLLIVLITFSRSLLQVEKRDIKFLLFYGLILSMYNAIWTLSVKFNGAAISTVLAYGSVGMTAILERWLFQEKIKFFRAVAIILSILGIILVSGAHNIDEWSLNFWGILIGLFSGLLFSGYSLMGREAVRREINSWTALLYTFMIAAILLFFYDFVSSGTPLSGMLSRMNWLGDLASGWSILLVLALIPTIGGYGLYTLSLRYLPATVSNLIASTEPSMTAVEAYFFLNERLTGLQIFGSILIISGVVLLRIREKKPK